MTKRTECSDSENIVRAIRSADYDGRRISSGLFQTDEISVSRLLILGLSDLFPIFHRDLDREMDPPGKVIGAGEINVGVLKQIGSTHSKPTVLTVEIDPKPENPAHAIIPQKLSRGLRRKITEKLIFHPDPGKRFVS